MSGEPKDDQEQPEPDEKTFIGVLASRDDPRPNKALVELLTELSEPDRIDKISNFHFVFTGGTYGRVLNGAKFPDYPEPSMQKVDGLDSSVAKTIQDGCGMTALPSTLEGGVTVLARLVSEGRCNIIWPFFSAHSSENHWLRPENLALMRLCDQWHVKRLMNKGSVLAWFESEADLDKRRNLQPLPRNGRRLTLPFPIADTEWGTAEEFDRPVDQPMQPRHRKTLAETPLNEMSVALIAHDEMKARMIEFVLDHERELARFGVILATGTTGREVAAIAPRLDKRIIRYHSGPKGGDVEIATAILYGYCDVVVFFIDPLNPHPHIEDIRVVFEACMVSDRVVMITNEMHAREFMSRVIREREEGREREDSTRPPLQPRP